MIRNCPKLFALKASAAERVPFKKLAAKVSACSTWTITFVIVLFGSLCVENAASSAVTFTQLTNTTGGFSSARPSVNAHGTRIALLSDRDLTPGAPGNADGNDELFLWTQGVGITQLTNTATCGIHDESVAISADGTRIAFPSDCNLAGGNPDGNIELFLWTQGVGITQLTNTTPSYVGGVSPSISADGTRIVFISGANLAGGNPDGNWELFLWTQGVGFTQLTNTSGAGINNYSSSISADGTRTAFSSTADLTPGAPGNADGNDELFLWTQGVGFTQLTNTAGSLGEINNVDASISADGTRVAFVSNRDLTPGAPGNSGGLYNLFLWTQGVGFTQLTIATGAGAVFDLSISADGTRTAFSSTADLTPGAPGNADGNAELFLWAQGAGITQLTNTTPSYAGGLFSSSSADGTRIAFTSNADLTPGAPGNTDGNPELFLAKLPKKMTQELVVNGFTLHGNEEQWVRFVGESVVWQLLGSRSDKIRVAAQASWWGLKEGTFSLSNPIVHSICNSVKNGKSKDVRLKPLEICDPGRAWQIGLAAVQVPNFTEQEALDVVQGLWPRRAVADVLVEAAQLAGFDPSKGTGAAIVASTGVLRKSWLLRNPTVGLTLVERNVTAECVNAASSWCYGIGWKQTAKYAPTRDGAMQSIADLMAIFDVIAP